MDYFALMTPRHGWMWHSVWPWQSSTVLEFSFNNNLTQADLFVLLQLGIFKKKKLHVTVRELPLLGIQYCFSLSPLLSSHVCVYIQYICVFVCFRVTTLCLWQSCFGGLKWSNPLLFSPGHLNLKVNLGP